MKKFILCALLFPSTFFAQSYTFSNTSGGSIPDNNTYVSFPITVSGISNSINSATFGLEKVTINISHPATGDLRIKLQSPDGQQFILSSFVSGTNYTSTIFSDTSSQLISNGVSPFTGVYKAVDALANFNNGQDPNGSWKLNIRDGQSGNSGNCISWNLTFSNTPAGYVNFYSSDLPIVIINTQGQQILDGTEITADMGVIYNGAGNRNYITNPSNHYNGKISIEIRGQTSTWFEQQQYHVETKDSTGLLNNSVSLFNMPIENDWVLYAPYNDKSLMRNALTYKLSRDLGKWAARTRFCEVMLNGSYNGVYAWMEKIKRDNNRVDIKKMLSTDNLGDAVTGGYIFSIDKDTPDWYSGYAPNNSIGQTIGFHYVYPKPADITIAQSNYLQAYVDSFEQALDGTNFQDPLSGYRKFASVKSFSDYFLINEVSNNVDGYRLSTYLHKDRNSLGGLLKAGPAWDYNLAWRNADYCNGDRYDVWTYDFNNVCGTDNNLIPFWWEKLVQDSAFQKQTYCRWLELRSTVLDTVNLFAVIDSVAAEVNEAKERHYTRFPILGTYVWPNPNPLASTYAEELRNTKDWIVSRLDWLDLNMIGQNAGPCAPLNVSSHVTPKEISIQTFPNPFENELMISLDFNSAGKYRIELIDVFGKVVSKIADESFSNEDYTFHLDLHSSQLSSGIYFLKISGTDKIIVRKLVRQ
jgi:subtilisin-like proprotein convertase family protein